MLLKEVTLSFPRVFHAEKMSAESKKAKYSAAFIFPAGGEIEKRIEAEMKEVAKARWGEKAKGIYSQLKANNKLCLRPGIQKAELEGFGEDVSFISASNDKRPTVIDPSRQPLAQDDGRIYPGAVVNAIVEIWAQDNQHGKRINAQLQGVQFVRDGTPLGGGGKPADPDEFPELEDEAEEDWGAEEAGDDEWDDDQPF